MPVCYYIICNVFVGVLYPGFIGQRDLCWSLWEACE